MQKSSQHQHLKYLVMDNVDTKQELSIHVILGASEYAKLKTSSVPRVGHSPLPSNQNGSLRRIDHLVNNLEKELDHLGEYDRIIQGQPDQEIVERVVDEPQGEKRVFPTS